MASMRGVPIVRNGKRTGFLTVVKELPGVYRTGDGKYFFFHHGRYWNVQKKNDGSPGHHVIGSGYATLSDAVSSIATDH
ncbi:MAG: hypothetical protein PHS57_06295 [Alphaproteobacteria bacterium]|nr:hypothetical protein [Alphaproteobacteria bacterium]